MPRRRRRGGGQFSCCVFNCVWRLKLCSMQINFQFPAILPSPAPLSSPGQPFIHDKAREGDAVGRQSKLICINVAKAKQKPTTNQKLPSARCLPPPAPCCCCCCCCIVGQRPRRKFANKKSKLISFAPVAAAAAIKKRCPSSAQINYNWSRRCSPSCTLSVSLSASLSLYLLLFHLISDSVSDAPGDSLSGLKQHRQTSS